MTAAQRSQAAAGFLQVNRPVAVEEDEVRGPNGQGTEFDSLVESRGAFFKGAQGCLRVALRFEADDRRQAGGKAARPVTAISKGQLAWRKPETHKLRLAGKSKSRGAHDTDSQVQRGIAWKTANELTFGQWNCYALSAERLDYIVGTQDGKQKGRGLDIVVLSECRGKEQDLAKVWNTNRFFVGEAPVEGDPASGVAIVLSARVANRKQCGQENLAALALISCG